jgi:hypothetical protein
MADILKMPKAKSRAWLEFEAEFLTGPIPRAKPKPIEVTAELSPKLAALAKANPAGVEVRVSAREGTITHVDPPKRPTELIEVLEVDGEGRPALARRIDCETGERSIVEFDRGYRPAAGAVSDYNPLDALKRD